MDLYKLYTLRPPIFLLNSSFFIFILDLKLADECKLMSKDDYSVYIVGLKEYLKSSTVNYIRANNSIKRMMINRKSNLKPQIS